VAATRGRESNWLCVDVLYGPDPDTSHGGPERQSAAQVLAGVLGNDGADMATHTMIRSAQDAAESVVALAAEYHTIAWAAQAERWDALLERWDALLERWDALLERWDALLERSGLSGDELVEARESEAYGPLVVAFREAEARGLDVDRAFRCWFRGGA
jgi:hypothetical protein